MRPEALPNPIPNLSNFDVVCLNAGNWDAAVPTPVDQYEANLRSTLDVVFESRPTARVVLVTTTPVAPFPEFGTANQFIVLYNEVLRRLSADHPQVTICDLYQYVVDNTDSDPWSDGTHFTPAFSEELAGQVYFSVIAVLPAAHMD